MTDASGRTKPAVLICGDPELMSTVHDLGLELELTFADNYGALLTQMGAHSFDVTLVASDGKDAPHVLREARARHGGARILLVSAPKDRTAVHLLLEGVVDGLLERPIHRDELLYSLGNVGATATVAALPTPSVNSQVLLVAPEPYDEPPLAELLEANGLPPTVVADADAALEVLERNAQLGVGVLDLENRNVEWSRLALRLHGRAHCEVLCILPHTAAGLASSAASLYRGVDFVARPLRAEDVLARVRRLHDRFVERREREQQDTAAPSVWIASRSPMMRRTLGLVESVAPTETTVCMRGEVGVGKEVLARLLHEWSPRGSAPMCSVNCATFPESQLDAEIFGIDRDPLSGAVRQRRGLVELAAGGTLFLDEIDALSVGMQTKVLQMLEDREFVRIGGVEVLHADLRIIASTSRSLEALVQQGRFDRNLYRWLMQVPLPVPPLRERPDDIPELATFLLRRIARAQGRPAARFSTAVVPKLLRHEWPGNVTELEQVLARALARSGGTEVRELDPASLAHAFRTQRDPEATAVDLSPLQDPTSFAVLLLAARGNAKTAAAIAGVDRGAFYARLVAMQADPLARSMFN